MPASAATGIRFIILLIERKIPLVKDLGNMA